MFAYNTTNLLVYSVALFHMLIIKACIVLTVSSPLRIGASGSGKSTFLNVLCGKAFYGKQSGTINVRCRGAGFNKTVNSLAEVKNTRGFVP